MRKLALLLLCSAAAFAQVGINTTSPGAVLDIHSTTSGILVPRLTTAQRDSIASPTASELLYNSDANAFEYWQGSAWVAVGSQNIEQVLNVGNTVTNNNSLNMTAYDYYTSNTTAIYYRTQAGDDSTQLTAEGVQTVSPTGGGFQLTNNTGTNFGQLVLNSSGTAGLVTLDGSGLRRTFQDNNYTGLVFEAATGTGTLIVPNVGTATDTLATVGQMSKEAVYYVGGQDSTGLTGVVEKRNNTGLAFTFTRTAVGTFDCSACDPTKHVVTAVLYTSGSFFGFAGSAYYTYAGGLPIDTPFSSGGWIMIRQYD